ncbi:MAG: LysE family transporter, partial [Spirochaetota bacterium]|nr:LysE family transporter [Spirochaetota bacterium]
MELDLYVQFSIIIGSGLVLGLLSAIPVGAVQLEVVKKAINGHLTPAIAMAFGSVTSDFIYGILTLFSLGGFLLNRQFQIGTYVCGILVISFLFYRSLKEYRQGTHKMDSHLVYKKRLSYLTGFTIAITNPGMIIWWLIGFKIFIDITHFSTITTTMKLLFIISGCTGLGGYLI